MKRTTIKIPEAMDARLRQEAERRGVTISTVTREALEAHLGGGDTGRPRQRRALSAAGSGHSGRSDISERIEELLAEELAERSPTSEGGR